MKTKRSILFGAFLAALVAISSVDAATTYDVGPGQPLGALFNVPWKTLKPGDVVNIHAKPGGYHEKIQISASGTSAAHIVIRGIADPVSGALPIIDAKDAVEDPSIDWRNPVFSSLGVIVVSPRKSNYLYGQPGVSWVDIETLDIRNARYTADNSITYTDQNGAVRTYNSFACGIYIEWALDTAIRGCEISFCGNGLFANSKNLVIQSSQRLLVEKNYFHDNSNPYTTDPTDPTKVLSNGYGEHHMYTESAGITIQFNRFGPLRAGAHGCAIKDRSSGEIIRYNEFDMKEQSNVLALLDPQGGSGFIDVQPDYCDSYVYGNLITVEAYASGMTAFWWGGYNGPNYYAAGHRGTLYFYNNTIVNHHNRLDLFLLPDTTYTGAQPTFENVDCRNNVFFSDTVLQSSIYETMYFTAGGNTNGGGAITFGSNWISPGWRKDSPNHVYAGPLNGTANLLVGDSLGANNPRFVDVNAHDYHVFSGSNILDGAGPLAAQALPANDDTLEYFAPQSSQPRVTQSAAPDLGAVESSGAPPPPPMGGSLQFSASGAAVAENAGAVVLTVTRTGSSSAPVSVNFATAGGSATSSVDFTPKYGTLAWAAGDLSPKTITIPIIDDVLVESSETFAVTLSNVGGGVIGSPATETVTILDNDAPAPIAPATIYALTVYNNLLSFSSNAPGVITSNVPITGLAANERMRATAIRPSTGALYGVGDTSRVYVINAATGVATAVGAGPFTPALAQESFDIGFPPTTDELRLVGSKGQHLRLSPDTGAVISVDSALAYSSTDSHVGAVPAIAGGDYGYGGVFYAIDSTLDLLVRVGTAASANNGQLSTVGPLGFNTADLTGLDIARDSGIAFACLSTPGTTTSKLCTVNLLTGTVTSLGVIGGPELIRDIAVAQLH
jgi:hypothetical protein